jgi:hypothetical protein
MPRMASRITADTASYHCSATLNSLIRECHQSAEVAVTHHPKVFTHQPKAKCHQSGDLTQVRDLAWRAATEAEEHNETGWRS